MNNNFDYSIELMTKMSELLKPDFLSMMKNEVDQSGYECSQKPSKQEMLKQVSELIKEVGSVASHRICGSYEWLIVFNCKETDILMTVCEIKSGSSFRYKVNDFEENDFNNTIDYIAITMLEYAKRNLEQIENKKDK